MSQNYWGGGKSKLLYTPDIVWFEVWPSGGIVIKASNASITWKYNINTSY